MPSTQKRTWPQSKIYSIISKTISKKILRLNPFQNISATRPATYHGFSIRISRFPFPDISIICELST
jgi:hypothetical protein